MKRELSEDKVARSEGGATSGSDSMGWSHTAQIDPEERKGRRVTFKFPIRPASLRQKAASQAAGSGYGSMSSITLPQSSQGGSVDHRAQVPPEVRVPGAPTMPAAMCHPAPTGRQVATTLGPNQGLGVTGMSGLSQFEGQIPTGPAAWRHLRKT